VTRIAFALRRITKFAATDKVCPGTKVLALGAQNDRAAGSIRVEVIERISQPADHAQVKVIVGRSVPLDGGYEIVTEFNRNVAESDHPSFSLEPTIASSRSVQYGSCR
jgi:hypothetical protein